MTSETPNLHVSKNLKISKMKQDIKKLETALRLLWKCCSVTFKIGSTIFSSQWDFNDREGTVQLIKIWEVAIIYTLYHMINRRILCHISTICESLNSRRKVH